MSGSQKTLHFAVFLIRTIEMWLQEHELALFEHGDLRLSTQMQKSLSCETESLYLK